jgi:transglutaminase-like putative cysteine protease
MRRKAGERGLFWEEFAKSYVVKATALLLVAAMTVVSCGKDAGLSRALSDLHYDSLPAKDAGPQKPAEKLHVAVRQLKALLAAQSKHGLSGDQAKRARAARATIDAQLRTVERQFSADRVELGKLGAKAALERLDKIQTKTATLKRSLSAALARVPANGEPARIAASNASKALNALSPDRPEQALSSDLAFGIKNGHAGQAPLSAGITPAYNSPVQGAMPSSLARAPEQADTDATPETAITPAIHALAQQLGGDPVKIYGYVRNNIRYEPYYGVRKGADQTLAEKSGSDADQAALLIALLRDSGIPARFVQGTAELPAAKAANWLGVDTANGERLDAVPEILASGGIPTSQIRASGQVAKVRFSHIWAEAYVPAEAYRGAEEGLGGKNWLPLDPSIKQLTFKQPGVDLQHVLRPAVEDWAHAFENGSQTTGDGGIVAPRQAQLDQQNQELVASAQSVLRDHGITDGDHLSDVVGSRDIAQVGATYLPSSTPFRALTVVGEMRAVPDNLSASVEFEVSGSDPLSMPSPDPDESDNAGFSFRAKTLALANKRITIGYAPASVADSEILDVYHGLLNAPTYAAALIPVLRVGGQVVAHGHQGVSTGYSQNFRIVYRAPGFAADTVENPIEVGGLSAVSLDLGQKSLAQIRQRAEALGSLSDGTTYDNILTDARAGEMMSLMGDLYFARNDQYNSVFARTDGVDAHRSLSGAIVATGLRTTLLAGFPISTSLGGASFDVDEDVQSVVRLSTNGDALNSYVRTSGSNTSLSEGQILEHIFQGKIQDYSFHGEAASTTKILATAAGQGIPIYKIDSSNVDTVVPQLAASDGVRQQIREVVSEGATVVAPRSGVTLGGWSGTGYVVMNGTSSDYRISGGASGGGWEPSPLPIPFIPTDKKSLAVWIAAFLGLDKRVAACIGVVLDIATVWTLGTDFAGFAGGWAAGLLEVGIFTSPALAVLVTVLVTAAIFVYAALLEWNDSIECMNNQEGSG